MTSSRAFPATPSEIWKLSYVVAVRTPARFTGLELVAGRARAEAAKARTRALEKYIVEGIKWVREKNEEIKMIDKIEMLKKDKKVVGSKRKTVRTAQLLLRRERRGERTSSQKVLIGKREKRVRMKKKGKENKVGERESDRPRLYALSSTIASRNEKEERVRR